MAQSPDILAAATPAVPEPSDTGDTLLTAAFMQRLDRLDIASRRILSGKLMGERRSKKRGQSVEFADYRNYVAGDDLRFIDWNLYARLDKLFIRLFQEEEDLSVSLIIDVSKSMRFGNPDKLLAAKRLAAALGYIALTHYNRVALYAVSDTVNDSLRGLRGRRPVGQVMDFLKRQQPRDRSDLAAASREFALRDHNKGVVILLSDFLDKGDVSEALRFLTASHRDVFALHILSPQELDPGSAGVVGDLRLIDIEDDENTEVSAGGALLRQYKLTLRNYCESLRQTCLRRGASYLLANTATPFETIVLDHLRKRGLLQ